MAGRPRYTEAQLGEYFDRVSLPTHRRLLSVSSLPAAEQLAHLGLLLKHQLVKVPFENLTQHYSWHRVVDVSPPHLFKKIVHQPGRGGYCMEANSLFHTVLLSLGYDVYMAGARVYESSSGRYGGFTHCVNIVTVGGARYMLDVGFGGNGPTTPVPLRVDDAGAGQELPHISPARMRLRHEPIPQQVNQGGRVWIYQHHTGAEGADWTPMYCFVDVEFILEDIRAMNLAPWRDPTSFFARRIIMTRFTTDREPAPAADGGAGPRSADEEAISEGGLDGAIILFDDTLKWRRNGETRLQVKFKSEEERVEALERYFRIVLDEEDRGAIRGTVSEIGDGW
ncbi:hypothetical protein DL763_001599 [Monosporascus cannonballus]|nr:hypothetical protein DL763_001599 [Monosporascus cannonballus]